MTGIFSDTAECEIGDEYSAVPRISARYETLQ